MVQVSYLASVVAAYLLLLQGCKLLYDSKVAVYLLLLQGCKLLYASVDYSSVFFLTSINSSRSCTTLNATSLGPGLLLLLLHGLHFLLGLKG